MEREKYAMICKFRPMNRSYFLYLWDLSISADKKMEVILIGWSKSEWIYMHGYDGGRWFNII